MRFYLFMLFVWLPFCNCFCDDITDKAHTIIYAKHLILNKEYDLAIAELNIFTNDGIIDSADLLLLKACFEKNDKRLFFENAMLIQKDLHVPGYITQFIGAAYLCTDSLQVIKQFDYSVLNDEIQLSALIIQNRLTEAHTYYMLNPSIDTSFINYSELMQTLTDLNRHKKYLPLLASVIVPGAGKMLIGEKYEGMIVLVVTSLYTVLSVRSFNQYGPYTYFGFVNAALALGFYGGNIAGTYRAVKRIDTYKRQQKTNELKANLYSHYLCL